MDNNWIVENLTNAFGVWNSKMTEMWSLLTESPQTFKGGTIWQTIVTINGGMQAIGYGLLVLFFCHRYLSQLFRLSGLSKAGALAAALYLLCAGKAGYHLWYGLAGRCI